jgi:hypothetical protein
LPLLSLVTQVTGVVPMGKKLPEGGVHTTRGGPSQLSVALTLNVTMLPLLQVSALTRMGQLIWGGSESETVTVKLPWLVLPAASVTVHDTVVTSLLKLDPLGGLHVRTAAVQLSEKVGVYITLLLLHCPGSVSTTISDKSVRSGGVVSLTTMVWEQLDTLPHSS